MILSIGNLLTLLIVVVVLIIYRQIDRNNRSLDKVKRYSDKVKGDLDTFVDGKTTELKNLTIELDVHQKTAKEILKRIAGIEESLKGKTDSFEKIQSRVTEYDKALGELVTMTGRVEENLKRLHSESEFVDSVGRRIKDTAARLATLEKSLPEIKEEFAKLSEKEMKEAAARVLKTAKDDALAVDRQVDLAEKSVKSFATYLSGLEARRDALEAQTIKNLQNAFQGFVQNAKDTSLELRRQFETNLTVMLEKATESGKSVTDRIALLQGQLKEEVSVTEKSIADKLEAFQDRIGAMEQTYQETIRDVAERARSLEDDVFVQLKGHIEGRAREVQKQLSTALSETRAVLEESRKEISHMFGETRSSITVWQAEMHKLIEDETVSFNAKYADLTKTIDGRLAAYVATTDKETDDQEKRLSAFIDEMRGEVRDFEKDMHERLDALADTADEKEASFKSALEEIERRNSSLADGAMERFTANISDFEDRMSTRLVEIETRVAEHESDVGYRFTKLEEVNVDVEELDRNLRDLIEKVKSKIQADFDLFSRQLGERRAEERKKAESELAALHGAVEELERGMAELKTRAYENVSGKLRLFEDEFLEDLKTRGAALGDELAKWQKSMDARRDEIAAENERLRTRVEQEFTEELSARLGEVNSRTAREYAKFEERVSGFEEGIKQRLDLSDSTIRSFEEAVRQELADAKEAAAALFRRDFSAHGAEVAEQIKKYEKDVEAELGGLKERIGESRNELSGVVDAVRAEISSWQADMLVKLQHANGTIEEDLSGLRASVADEIDAAKEDFATQRQELVVATQEERNRLRAELVQVNIDVERLTEELKARSDKALATFRQEYDAFIAELQGKTREGISEADQKLKELRAFVQESFDKSDQMQKRLAAKVEESYKSLSLNLQELDKKTKDFAAQTKVFERADSLKLALTSDIEELRAEIAKIQAETKEIRELEKDLQKTKKMGDEVSTKLGKFLAEKRRIEVMEGDFKKLLSMSQSVDTRLGQVTSSHDQLQSIQAQIRNLEELEKEVLAKYERLEAKKEIIDSTTDGVDKSFQTLESLEKNLRAAEESVTVLPPRIAELTQRVELLAKNKKEADETINQLSTLQATMRDIEERIEKMQSAREWLARTETRLEEIGRQAEEQVKLLGSLLKEEGKSGSKKEKGAPSLSTRDMVTRLAHQGWKVPQIAQATKLSRGEVELILELLPKSTTSK